MMVFDGQCGLNPLIRYHSLTHLRECRVMCNVCQNNDK